MSRQSARFLGNATLKGLSTSQGAFVAGSTCPEASTSSHSVWASVEISARACRAQTIALVLATDMKQHFTKLSTFQRKFGLKANCGSMSHHSLHEVCVLGGAPCTGAQQLHGVKFVPYVVCVSDVILLGVRVQALWRCEKVDECEGCQHATWATTAF